MRFMTSSFGGCCVQENDRRRPRFICHGNISQNTELPGARVKKSDPGTSRAAHHAIKTAPLATRAAPSAGAVRGRSPMAQARSSANSTEVFRSVRTKPAPPC